MISIWLNAVIAHNAFAHLMVAQHGTVNLVGDGAYTVMSLPVSAFSGIDDDGDGGMSHLEFIKYRSEISNQIINKIRLYSKEVPLELQGIMLTPVVEHGRASASAKQIVLTGRFKIPESATQLQLEVDLYGITPAESQMEIIAKNKKSGLKNLFILTNDHSKKILFKP